MWKVNTQTSNISWAFTKSLPKLYQTILMSCGKLGVSYVWSSDFMWEDTQKFWPCSVMQVYNVFYLKSLALLEHHWSLKDKFLLKSSTLCFSYICVFNFPLGRHSSWGSHKSQILQSDSDLLCAYQSLRRYHWAGVMQPTGQWAAVRSLMYYDGFLRINIGYHIAAASKGLKCISSPSFTCSFPMGDFLLSSRTVLHENALLSIVLRNKKYISLISWLFHFHLL